MTPDSDPGQTPPLKRHPSLQPLSREHMSGLVHARALARAADGDAAARLAAATAFRSAWAAEISHHFDDEERLLIHLIKDPALTRRLLDEHRALRSLAEQCPDLDPAVLRQLGGLLHDHIRWEERVLFEAIQRDHPHALEGLGPEAEAIHDRRPAARPRSRLDP